MHDECNIVHRDLKPENVLLEKEGEMDNLRLIDFGTCKIYKDLKSESGKTMLRERVGTMAYIAPEILNLNTMGGDLNSDDTFYSEKCDLWSIGVIAYMLLCGKNPFLQEQD